MKKIFLILAVCISVAGLAQPVGIGTYNPINGTLSNKPYAPAQAVPTDMRSYFYDATNHVFRAYQNTAEVVSYLTASIPKFRAGHFLIYIHVGGTLNGDGSYTGGTVEPYWFRDGTADGDLVPFTGADIAAPPVAYDFTQFISGGTYLIGTDHDFVIAFTTVTGSVSVYRQGVLVPYNVTGDLSYTVSYDVGSTTITFNEDVPPDERITIYYLINTASE